MYLGEGSETPFVPTLRDQILDIFIKNLYF